MHDLSFHLGHITVYGQFSGSFFNNTIIRESSGVILRGGLTILKSCKWHSGKITRIQIGLQHQKQWVIKFQDFTVIADMRELIHHFCSTVPLTYHKISITQCLFMKTLPMAQKKRLKGPQCLWQFSMEWYCHVNIWSILVKSTSYKRLLMKEIIWILVRHSIMLWYRNTVYLQCWMFTNC